jgi:hypothetical protein
MAVGIDKIEELYGLEESNACYNLVRAWKHG